MRSPPSRLVHKLPQLRDLHSFFLEQLGLFPGIFYTLKHNESNHQSQMNLTESTVLVYDPLKTAQGQCSFRAFRISQDYIDMINYDAENDYWPEPTLKELRDGKISTKVENRLFFNIPNVFRIFLKKSRLLWRLHSSQTCLFSTLKIETPSTPENPSSSRQLLLP